MKQPRTRQGLSRGPVVRSRLSIPMKPNTRVQHHMSVKKVPAPDGLLNIIKQTVVVKSQKKNKGKRKYPAQKGSNRRPPSAPYGGSQSYNKPSRHNYNKASSSYAGNPRQGYMGKGHGQTSGSKGHSSTNYGRGKNSMNNHPSLLPVLSSLSKNLGGLIDALRGGNQKSGHHQTYTDPHPAGTAMPIIVVDNSGYGHGHSSLFGPSHPTSIPGTGHAGQFPGSMTVSPFSHSKSSQQSSHSSPPRTSHRELLIMPNGPNTKSIRISTNGRYSFAKSNGAKNNNAVVLVEKNSHRPAAHPTLSGEDPPEVGEAAEP